MYSRYVLVGMCSSTHTKFGPKIGLVLRSFGKIYVNFAINLPKIRFEKESVKEWKWDNFFYIPNTSCQLIPPPPGSHSAGRYQTPNCKPSICSILSASPVKSCPRTQIMRILAAAARPASEPLSQAVYQ